MENQCRQHAAHAQALENDKTRLDRHGREMDELKQCVVKLTHLQESSEEWRKDAEQRIKNLESAPAKKWDNAMNYIIVALISAGVTYFFGQIGF